MIFVDTNYFLRYILKDIPNQSQKAFKLFDDASIGKKQLSTDTIVLFEIYWVLKNLYGVKHPFVKETLLQICYLDFIHLTERDILFEAISNLDSFGFDLEDSYHFSQARVQKAAQIATFDKNLKKKFDFLNQQ